MPLGEVAVICHKYPPYSGGGLAVYAERSLWALRQAYPELPVTLYTVDYPEGMPATALLPDGLRVRRPRMPAVIQRRMLRDDVDFGRTGRLIYAAAMALFNLQTVWQVAVRHRKDAVVAVHDWQSAPAGVVLAILFRRRVVYHVHNTEMTMVDGGVDYGASWLIGAFESLLARLASRVVVPSTELREQLADRGWSRHRITVVPHGFEEPAHTAYRGLPEARRRDARAQLRAELGIAADERVVVFVGRLSRVKGVHTLMDAVPAVLSRHPKLRVLLLGVGFPGTSESADLNRHVAALGIEDHVLVYDRDLPPEAVARHYDLADVCVFPSIFEPFGFVAVEAMSFARPVVLGSGFTRVICRNETGPNALVMRTDGAVELSELIAWVLDQPEKAAALATRARDYVTAELTWRNCIDATVATYRDVAGERKPHANHVHARLQRARYYLRQRAACVSSAARHFGRAGDGNSPSRIGRRL
ncbi:MAG TPA: glycosyltransferase family 4 protein [Trebonia sp.]|nr:glycosyltransferase family 4 protein [Trebonia sp.]